MHNADYFDYEWRKIGNGRYIVRIKSTNEETEVSIEVMRELWRAQKEAEREYEGSRSALSVHHPLSTDSGSADSDGSTDCNWLSTTVDYEDSLAAKELTDRLKKALTPKQLDVFEKCIEQGQSVTEYAAEHSIVRQSVYDTLHRIQKKAGELLKA